LRTNADQQKPRHRCLDISSAAYQAGYSSREFRKIIEEDRIPVLRIGRKHFIVVRDLEAWKSTRGEARLDETIQRLDGWLKERSLAAPDPIDEFNRQHED
jgi:hypothetical protein